MIYLDKCDKNVGDIHELRKSIGLDDLIIDMAFNRPGRIKNATLAYSELSSLFIINWIRLVVMTLIGLIHL